MCKRNGGDMPNAPLDLIGSGEACEILGITRGTLSRQVAAGKLVPLQKMPGHTGAFVFLRRDVEAAAQARASRKAA